MPVMELSGYCVQTTTESVEPALVLVAKGGVVGADPESQYSARPAPGSRGSGRCGTWRST